MCTCTIAAKACMLRVLAMDVTACRKSAEALAMFLCQYKWLLDIYVIEFFTEQHWKKLPRCWQEALSLADLKEVGRIFLNQNHRICDDGGGTICQSVSQVYPLSLLAFAAAAQAMALPRIPHSQQTVCSNLSGCSQVEGMDHSFRKHVKPKKQHEIKCLAEVVSSVAEKTNCQNVIDMGSGQGHLARFLAYNSGLRVTAVEAVGGHLTAAAKFDEEVKKEQAKERERRRRRREGTGEAETAAAEVREETDYGAVRHIQSVIEPGCSVREFLSLAGLTIPLSHTLTPPTTPPTSSISPTDCSSSSAQETSKERYIIVGLHTCGDLGATMMRVYKESEQICGLVSLGCCYMKLSCHVDTSSAEGTGVGYPLSEFVRSLLPRSSLSYEAREVACHSIETYSQRLGGEEESGVDHLRVHCHRAAVETVLRKQYGMKRAQVRISKRVSKLSFPEYAQALLASVGRPSLTEEEISKLDLLVSQWKKVAMFFVLRLALAPCVESLLLLDRAIFLVEQNSDHAHTHTHKPVNVHLTPVFNPKMSPRNIALIAVK